MSLPPRRYYDVALTASVMQEDVDIVSQLEWIASSLNLSRKALLDLFNDLFASSERAMNFDFQQKIYRSTEWNRDAKFTFDGAD